MKVTRFDQRIYNDEYINKIFETDGENWFISSLNKNTDGELYYHCKTIDNDMKTHWNCFELKVVREAVNKYEKRWELFD